MSTVGTLVARGSRLQADVAAAVLDGSLHLTVDEVSQLEVTLADPDGRLATGRLLGPGAEVRLGDYPVEVTSYEMGENRAGRYLTVTALSRGAQMLRLARGAKTWPKLTSAQFVQQEAAVYGLKALVEPSAFRGGVTREGPDATVAGDLGESSYDVLQRLAAEEGRIAFEALGTVYFGRPSWLVTNLPRVTVTWGAHAKVDGALLRMPTCRRTTSDPAAPRTVELAVTPDVAVRYRPGMALDLRGIPDFETRYLVTEVRVPFSDLDEGRIKARTVVDPTPVETAAGAAAATGSLTATETPASDLMFARFVNALVLQESGGSYTKTNPRTGALGRYQVLPGNVGLWSKEILNRTVTPAEYLRQSALQDQIAIGMLRRYYDAHGVRGAAARWYSGKAERQNDTTPVQGGREPSVKAYVDSVEQRMRNAPTTLPSGYTGPGATLTGERAIQDRLVTGPWYWPVDTGPVTSGFGPRRQPAGGGSTDHKGIDVGVPIGTPINASRAGRVTFAGTASGYGTVIYLDHGLGLQTRYAHLSRLLVKVGQSIAQGQRIALSGNTGIFTTGPHLHFEVRRHDTPQDPLRVLPAR